MSNRLDPTGKMRRCVLCGKEYDALSFLVKLKSNGQTYTSMDQCRECAKKDPNCAEVIENK